METSKTQIEVLSAKDYGLEENKAKEIKAQFTPMLDKMEALEDEANEVFNMNIDGLETPGKAKETRLKYVKVRTGTAAIHKEQKAFYRAAGLYIDGWKNAQLFASEGIEKRLLNIEKHAENIEKERINKLGEERKLALENCGAQVIPDGLGSLSTDVWDSYLLGAKTTQENAIKEKKRISDEAAKKQVLELKITTRNKKLGDLKLYIESHDNLNFAECTDLEFKHFCNQLLLRKNKANKKLEEDAKETLRLKKVEKELKAIKQKEIEEREAKRIEAKAKTKQSEAVKFDAFLDDLKALKNYKDLFTEEKYVKKITQANRLIDKIINHFNNLK